METPNTSFIYDEEDRFNSEEQAMMAEAGIRVEKPHQSREHVRYIDTSAIEARQEEIRRAQREMMQFDDITM